MSLFNDSDSTTSQTPSDNPTDQNKPSDDFLGKVVEMKGQHWSDPQEVAKGYLNSQQYIQELEAKNKELSEQAVKANYAEELKSLLQDKANPTPVATPVAAPQGDNTEQTPSQAGDVSEEVLESLVSKVLTQREAANTVAQNIAEADKKMEEAFGTEAKAHLDTRSKELGMSVEALGQIAGQSPSAFLALMGQTAPKETNTLPKGTLNTASTFMQKDERDMKYYSNLIKSNPKEFSKTSVQKQMREDKARLGARFFN